MPIRIQIELKLYEKHSFSSSSSSQFSLFFSGPPDKLAEMLMSACSLKPVFGVKKVFSRSEDIYQYFISQLRHWFADYFSYLMGRL